VNKLDNPKLELNAVDFYALGMGDPVAISSGTVWASRPCSMPWSRICRSRQQPSWKKNPRRKAADYEGGRDCKPNVGKSSFVNALLNEERVIG